MDSKISGLTRPGWIGNECKSRKRSIRLIAAATTPGNSLRKGFCLAGVKLFSLYS